MGVYPTLYNKEDFIKFLEKNNVNDDIIQKFIDLPQCIIYNGHKYVIYINSIWYSIGNTFYNFEINYYCDECVEFLFTSKVFRDVETSINNMIYEMENKNNIICEKQ